MLSQLLFDFNRKGKHGILPVYSIIVIQMISVILFTFINNGISVCRIIKFSFEKNKKAICSIVANVMGSNGLKRQRGNNKNVNNTVRRSAGVRNVYLMRNLIAHCLGRNTGASGGGGTPKRPKPELGFFTEWALMASPTSSPVINTRSTK